MMVDDDGYSGWNTSFVLGLNIYGLNGFFVLIIQSFIVLLLVPAFLVPLWINKVHRIATEAKLISYRGHQGILSGMENAAKVLSPTSGELKNLERYLSLSSDRTDPTFVAIETKVAPTLFLALSTIQHLSQISYIVLGGLFFSYYIKDDLPYAVYSNASFAVFTPGAENNYSWYTQSVNRNTGKLYGRPSKTAPLLDFNSSWFREALKVGSGHVSVGTGWSSDQDLLLLDMVTSDQRTALSFGFPVKPLTDFFWTSINVYGGALYVATNDGTSLFALGIPNTQMIYTGNSASIQLINPNGQQTSKVGDLVCQPNDGNIRASVLEILGKKYLLYCSLLEIVGVQSVYAIALPYGGLAHFTHQNVDFAVVLLVIIMSAMAISISTLIFLTIRAARREMYLCAALIKQLEATQQAERKSMSKSLAFARASHDIRGSLAAIIGLIQNASKQVGPGSEFQINLTLAETCTEELLGMLTSILDTSKIEAGKTQLEEEEFDLEQLLEDVVDLYYSVGMEKGVDVMLDPYDGTARKYRLVKGDRGKLKQILSNLLSNAVKFTAEGHVSVKVWARKPSFENEILASNRKKSLGCMPCLLFQSDDRTYKELKVIKNVQQDPNCMEFIFEVADTGKGIPKEKHKMVFENYVQVKDIALGQGGTGLGLGIVQSLVRIMGGEIAIMEKELGENGTCFRFNTFFILCGTEMREDNHDIESHGGNNFYPQPGPSTHLHSPRAVESHVVLFISTEERSKISKKFIESLGIKVSVVKNCEQLTQTLKKIKQRRTISRPNTSQKIDMKAKSNSHGRSMSSNSSSKSKELPLSAFDGTDVEPSSEKISARSTSNFILLVIDTSAGPFREISRAVAEFRKDLYSTCNRIVWIHKPNTSTKTVLDLEEDKLPPMDVIISKPLHGSRLYKIIGLLPEFGGTVPVEGNSYQMTNGLAESSTSNISAWEKFKSIHSSIEKGEIQEISSNIEKPLHGKKVLVEKDNAKPLQGKRVLVAEDNAVLRQLAKVLVSQLGADTETCKSGEEALQVVCRKLTGGRSGALQILPFDYILMDCEMTEMDGYEATRRIREEEKNYGVHIPIIAVTAYTTVEETKKMFEAGMDFYLPKPLRLDQLLNAISTIHGR